MASSGRSRGGVAVTPRAATASVSRRSPTRSPTHPLGAPRLSRSSRGGTRSASADRILSANYCPDLAGSIRHNTIIDIGKGVQRRVDMRYLEQQEAAVNAAITGERARGRERLVAAVRAAEAGAVARLEAALSAAEARHAMGVAELTAERDAQEAGAVARAEQRGREAQAAALEAAAAVAQERLARELQQCTLDVTNKVTREMLKKQKAAVFRARTESAERYARQLAEHDRALRTECDAEMQALRDRHRDELAALQARFDTEEGTVRQLEQQIDSLEAELAAAVQRHKELLEDYRRTLSVNLPNYSEQHSFLI